MYTVGQGGGDHYPTYSGVGGFVAAIGANQTGTLTGQNTGAITEVAAATITHNLVGFTLQIDSNINALGNYNNGHLITMAHNGHMFNLSQEQAGIVNICLLKAIRTVLPGATTRALFLVSNIAAAAQNINIYNNMHNGGGLGGHMLSCTERDPVVHAYSNMSWGGFSGITIDPGDDNGLNVFENNTFYNNSVAGVIADAFGGPGFATYRNNVCFNNLADYTNIAGGSIGRNNADSDGTAADGNWGGAGSGNQINLVTAAQLESLVAADGDPFLRPLAGSTLDTAGIGATYATTLINGVPQLVTIGAKGRIIPVSTGITRQSHTAISNTIAIM